MIHIKYVTDWTLLSKDGFTTHLFSQPKLQLNPIFPKLKLGWTWKMTLHQYPPPLLKVMVIVLLWLVIYSLINIDLPQHNKKTIKDNIKDNIKDIIKGNIKDD